MHSVKVLDPGHQYALASLDTPHTSEYEFLAFVKRVGPQYPGNAGFPYSGTNCQEVLRALIDRVKYLDGQAHCVENVQILACLRDAIRLFEERAADRHGRRRDWRLYEKDGSTNDCIEHLETCDACGHIGCKGGCKAPKECL